VVLILSGCVATHGKVVNFIAPVGYTFHPRIGTRSKNCTKKHGSCGPKQNGTFYGSQCRCMYLWQ